MPILNASPNVDGWVSTFKLTPAARFRLFCFPHAGGGATLFQRWQLETVPEIDICPIQLPVGRSG